MALHPIAAVVLLAGAFSSAAGAIYWQLAFCLFGAAPVLRITAMGNTPVLPAVTFAGFLAWHAIREGYRPGAARIIPMPAVWLTLAVIYGVLVAVYVPRLWEGQTTILTHDRTAEPGALPIAPLRPVSGNLTQSAYAIGSVVIFLSMRVLLKKPGRFRHFRDAVLLLATLNCVAALINFGEHYAGLPNILQYVRYAYALFGDYEVGGLMRIHGTFPETSMFSAFSMPLFAFTFSLWLNRVRPWYTGALAASHLVLLLVSTSTTALAGLVIYAMALVAVLTYRGYVVGSVPRIGPLIAFGLLLTALVGSLFVFETAVGKRMETYLASTLINKLESSSAAHRGAWNYQAWLNFLDTYGIGVGIGTARASSLLLVLISNLGALGSCFYLAFLKSVIGSRDRIVYCEPTTEAARQAVLGALATAFVSATVFDLGIAFYIYAAAASLGRAHYPDYDELSSSAALTAAA